MTDEVITTPAEEEKPATETTVKTEETPAPVQEEKPVGEIIEEAIRLFWFGVAAFCIVRVF